MLPPRRPASVALLVMVFTLDCGPNRAGPKPSLAHPSVEAVATVGNVPISAELVATVAREQHLPPRTALRLLVDDVVASEAAKAHGLAQSPDVRWSARAVLADRMLQAIGEAARTKGPPTDAEVAKLTAKHWRDVDAGESVRVVHVVAMRPKNNDPAKVAQAKAFIEKLERTLSKATGADEFEQIARDTKEPGVETRVERLPAFVEDGRTVEDGAGPGMDPVFAKAAFAIRPPADISPVTETKFGWHIIRVVTRLPAKHLSLEERRSDFVAETYTDRASGELGATIGQLRQAVRPEVDQAALSGLADLVEQMR